MHQHRQRSMNPYLVQHSTICQAVEAVKCHACFLIDPSKQGRPVHCQHCSGRYALACAVQVIAELHGTTLAHAAAKSQLGCRSNLAHGTSCCGDPTARSVCRWEPQPDDLHRVLGPRISSRLQSPSVTKYLSCN